MKALLRSTMLATALMAGSATVRAAPDPQPYRVMQTLQSLEDRIAKGDTIAQASHDKAMSRVGRDFAAMRPETWQDVRNARALISYLFSGGHAAIIAQAIPATVVNKAFTALYEGALAYGSADDERARTLLLNIDANALPAGLAGHLALVQATLCETNDRKKAIALLDLARLTEPGTLVEEAALRKELSLVGEDGDVDKLALLLRRYQTVFARSVYADNYLQLLAGLAKRAADANTEADNVRLERFLSSLGKDERRRLYLNIARTEVIAGHLTSATFAANAASKLAAHGDRDEARAMLYFGAAAIVGNQYDLALASLNGAVPSRLETKDATLRTSALDLAASLHAMSAEQVPAAPSMKGELATHGVTALRQAADVLGTLH